MTSTTGGTLTENLTAMPTAEAVRTIIQRAVAGGIPEQDALDDALGVLVGRTMELDGPQKTAARLLMVANALTGMVPPKGAKAN